MSGGTGTRLWPMSRELHPKQLLPLLGELSLLQETARRVSGPGLKPPILVSSDTHRFVVAEQMRAIGIRPRTIMLEPVARNTAPAIAAAAMLLAQTDPEALMLVCPADHSISNPDAFRAAVCTAAEVAGQGYLVTFGIPATGPETGYGYIRATTPLEVAEADAHPDHPRPARVGEFVEKPSVEVARHLLGEGGWSWNSGIFLFPPRLFLDELARLAPDIASSVFAAVDCAEPDLDFVRLGAPEFEGSPAISVDKAVMERTDRAAVVRAEFGWDDVGSWTSLWRMGDQDTSGNVVSGDVVDEGSSNCYVRSDDVLVATVGLEDTIVVATPDAVLVADKSQDQQVKRIVEKLKGSGRSEASAPRVVYRPWGTYEAVDAGPGYQVKHITVRPGHRLSLQTHSYRAEHWVVISGTADVVRGDDTLTLGERMSIDVPVGCLHRLGNPGPEMLHLIEVQTGPYLGEDDIVRYDDAYGRTLTESPR
ncbi:MAG: mannose-1-phosphate guanylyltransferase/mannose-6-phosphate isomerase [Nocardioidaceae bacterium]